MPSKKPRYELRPEQQQQHVARMRSADSDAPNVPSADPSSATAPKTSIATASRRGRFRPHPTRNSGSRTTTVTTDDLDLDPDPNLGPRRRFPLANNNANYMPSQLPYNPFSFQPGRQPAPHPAMGIPQVPPAVPQGMTSSSNHQNQNPSASGFASQPGGFTPPQMPAMPLMRQGSLPLHPQTSSHGAGGFPRGNQYGAAGQHQQQQQNHNVAVGNPGLRSMQYHQASPPMNLNAHQLAPGNRSVSHALHALRMHAAASSRPTYPVTQSLSLCVRISCPYDKLKLSPYQCLAREQIEYFSAGQDDLEAYARGRNKQIVIGQVGIRCTHCMHIPMRDRGRSSVYFPGRLQFVYQAAQNIGQCHLCDSCPSIPQATKKKLQDLRANKTTPGGGKIYWAEAAAVIGLIDTEDGIRFSPNAIPASR